MAIALARLQPFRRGRRCASAHGSTTLPVPAAPATPNTPSPADTATAYYTLLSWVSAGATKFDIYLDTVTPPVALAVPKYVGTSYVPTLASATTYYWKIVAFNDGGSATGPIWSFTTPAAFAVIFQLAGELLTGDPIFGSLSIHDAINAAPNTGRMRLTTTEPQAGETIQIGLGTLDDDHLIFGGEIQADDFSYIGTPEASPSYPVRLIDHTFTINKRRPFGTWVDVSATTIARAIASRFAPTFTTVGVQEGLPLVSINFDGTADFMSCMGALAKAISTDTVVGRTDVTYAKDLILSNVPDSATLDPVDIDHPPLNDPSPITFSTDLSQLRTRVYGKGHGETVPCDVAAGETIVPLTTTALFTVAGGQAIAGTTAGGAQTEILTYAGVQLGGTSLIVGPGVAPSVKPTAAVATGGSLTAGTHQWAYVWGTAAGTSLPSPISAVVTARNSTPPMQGVAPTSYPAPDVQTTSATNFFASSAGLTPGSSYTYRVQFRNSAGGWGDLGPASAAVIALPATNDASKASPIQITFDAPGPGHPSGEDGRLVNEYYVYRYEDGSTTGELIGFSGDISGLLSIFFLWTFTATDRGGGNGDPPTASSSGAYFTSALSAIAIGPTGTTFREVYQTEAGGTQLKLMSTIANNTATTATANAADAALGGNAPTSDTSGFTQPTGQINAGASSILTAGIGDTPVNGGWIQAGQQFVRYTGISGNTLTGIPISGNGAIVSTILYNSQIVGVPALTDVNHSNGLARAVASGSTVAIWVQRDDLVAQAALGALELDDDGNPTDGIREYTIIDGRRGETSLTALVDADLAIFSRPIVSAHYYTRDVETKSGRTVLIDLDSSIYDAAFYDPAFYDASPLGLVGGDFTIQDVTITCDGPALFPLREVTASSVAFTLQDLYRRAVIGD